MPVYFRDPKNPSKIQVAKDKLLEDGTNATPGILLSKGYEVVEKPGKVSSFLAGTATGIAAPFESSGESLADEAIGLAVSMFTGKPYEQARTEAYQDIQARKQLQPGAFKAGQATGTVANVGGQIAAAIMGGAPVLAAEAIVSPSLAAVSEYTKGDPSKPQERTDEERMSDAAKAAALTLAFMGGGAAIGKGIQLGTKAVRKAIENSPRAIQRAAREAALVEVQTEVAAKMAANEAADNAKLAVLKKLTTSTFNELTPAERRILRATKPKDMELEKYAKAEMRELARDLGMKRGTTKEAREFLKDKFIIQPEVVEAQFKATLRNKLTQEAITAKQIPMLKAEDGGWLSRAFRFLSDGRWVAADIDEKFGTAFAPALDKVSQRLRAKTSYMTLIEKEAKELDALAKKAGVDTTDELYGYMAGTAPVPDKAKPVVSKLREIFDRLLNDQQDMGVNISALKGGNYITKTLKQMDQRHTALQQQINIVKDKLGGAPLTLDAARQIKEGQDLIKGLEILEKGTFKFKTNTPEEQFQRLLKRHSEIPTAKEMDDMLANEDTLFRFAQERTGDIPDFLLEKDVFKILRKYTHHAMHNALVEPALVEMRAGVQMLKKLGVKASARHMEQLTTQIQTGQLAPGTWGRFQRFVKQQEFSWRMKHNAAYQRAKADGKNLTAAFHRIAYQAPEMWDGVVSSIYANLLGTPRQVLVNLSGAFTMGIPELGVKEFSRAFARVSKKALTSHLNPIDDVILDPATASKLGKKVGDSHTFTSFLDWATARTYISNEAHRRVQLGVTEGIEQGLPAPLKQVTGTIKMLNDASMYMFSKVEVFNRALASEAGRDIGTRLMKGTLSPQMEKTMLRKMDAGYRRTLEGLRRAGDVEGVENLLSEYFVARIALNYDKAQAAFFARNLGTLFSMFSKWPAHVTGEIAYKLRNRGAAEAALDTVSKYIMPAVVLGTIGYPLKQMLGETRYNAIIGKSGMVGWAPGTAASGFFTAEQFTPLPLDAAKEAFGAAVKINTDDPTPGVINVMNSLLKYIGPGAQYLNFFTGFAPAIIEGDSANLPRKSDYIGQIGRIVEGMN